jgi:hypothetical protein
MKRLMKLPVGFGSGAFLGMLMVSATLAQTSFASDCLWDPNDPFSQIEKMPEKSHFGSEECINTMKYRSAHRLNAEERAAFQIDADETLEVVANFNHQSKFWVAVIPKERIKDVVVQLIPLMSNSPVFHGQLRFRLHPEGRPIQLIEQSKDAENRKTLTLDEDIVFAEYGVRGQDHQEKFDIMHGLRKYYAVSYMVGSLSQNTAGSVKEQKLIRQYVLNMDAEQSVKALETGITIGTELKMERVYSTISQSCLNAMFFALNKALGRPEAKYFGRVWESVHPVNVLRRMGLIGKHGSSRIENFTAEQQSTADAESREPR